MVGLGTRYVRVPLSCLGALPAVGLVAAFVSNNKLPCHLEGCFPVVPVKGVEDVLILCLNPA